MKLKRWLAFLLAVLMSFASFCVVNAESDSADASIASAIEANPGITSGNAIVAYSPVDGQVLYSERLDERVAPAVATKLVAAMVVADVLRERNLDYSNVEVTVSKEAMTHAGNIIDARIPMMGFKAGDIATAKDLLSSTFVSNAYDAIAALACFFGEQYLGGGLGSFIDKMNEKAVSLGLENTHFVNATGHDSADQYSTPREIAKIASAFYGYDELVKLSDVESFSFKSGNTVRSKNYLKSAYHVKGYTNEKAIGIIGGQLDINGNYCLIAASEKEGRPYIFVVMCATGLVVNKVEDRYHYSLSDGNAYDDMNTLIKWTRDSFVLYTIATADQVVGELRVNLGNSTDHVMVVPAEQVDRLVINDNNVGIAKELVYDETLVYKMDFNGSLYDTVNAPVTAGQKVGTLIYSYNGKEIARVDAVAKESIESDSVKAFFSDIESFLFGDTMKTILIVIGAIIAIYILIVIVSFIVKIVNGTKKKKAKKAKQLKKEQQDNITRTKQFDVSDKPKNDPNASTREMR